MRLPAHWSSRTGSWQIIECQFCFTACFPVKATLRPPRWTCLCTWPGVIHWSVAFKTLGAFVPKSCENTTPQTPCIAPCHLTGKPGERCEFRQRVGSAGPDVRRLLFGQFCFTALTVRTLQLFDMRMFVHLGDRVSFTDRLPLRLWLHLFLSHVRTLPPKEACIAPWHPRGHWQETPAKDDAISGTLEQQDWKFADNWVPVLSVLFHSLLSCKKPYQIWLPLQ